MSLCSSVSDGRVCNPWLFLNTWLTLSPVLKADYSSALALLLRYPVPPDPHGPVTFVEDALYLRRNLTAQGGADLISKHSGKAPTRRNPTNHRSDLSRNSLHTLRNSADLDRTRSPMRSPGQILQESGGLEGLLQEAAKGVYRRSEQWGLSQAFRNAVQGLQSGSNTPRRSISVRRSLDEDGTASDSGGAALKIQVLEERNKALAKMLQESIEDISLQAKEFEEEKQEAKANRLTLSIAKLQFLQVHLENPAMPLGSDSTMHSRKSDQEGGRRFSIQKSILSPSDNRALPVSSPIPVMTRRERTRRQSSQDYEAQSPTRAPIRRPANISLVPRITRTQSPQQSPFQTSRPSLAQSSFSWMLGNGEDKPSFVSSAPFSPERDKRLAHRGKAGFLFGEDKSDSSASGVQKEKTRFNAEDDDGFTLGTLKGIDKS